MNTIVRPKDMVVFLFGSIPIFWLWKMKRFILVSLRCILNDLSLLCIKARCSAKMMLNTSYKRYTVSKSVQTDI